MSWIGFVPIARIHCTLWMAVSSMSWPTGMMAKCSRSTGWPFSEVIVGSVMSREIAGVAQCQCCVVLSNPLATLFKSD